jgi:thymidylate synthase (FAD)
MSSVETWIFERDGRLYWHRENDGPAVLRYGLEEVDIEIVRVAGERRVALIDGSERQVHGADWALVERFAARKPPEPTIPVLDHGFVRLVDSMGGDISIVRAARVSYDAAWRAGENEGSDARLIAYLWKNAHTSPFEAVEFQFDVKAPIFVLRQWHRHRTWSYNELSARYRELPEEFYVPTPESIGAQSTKNKQMRVDAEPDPAASSIIRLACQESFPYRSLLDRGVPREVARSVLPTTTYSHMFAKVNLRNLLHFLDLRLHPHAQFEIRKYAEALAALAEPVAPIAMKAWRDNCSKEV